MGTQKSSGTKTVLHNKRAAGGIAIPEIKLYYRALMVKTAFYYYKDSFENPVAVRNG